MGVVAEMADRVVVMRDGRMVEQGTVADIFERPQADYTRELLAAVPRLGSRRTAARTRREPPPSRPSREPVAVVNDLTSRFDLRGGFFGRVEPPRARRRRRELFDRAGRDAGAGRRERLRQVDDRQGAGRPGALTGRHRDRRRAICRSRPRRAQGRCAATCR